MRELSGIPALLVGGWLRKIRPLGKVSALMLIGRIILNIFEFNYLRSSGRRPADIQFFIGTLPIAAGLLGLAISLRDLTPPWLAELGRKESLGIYLYHPIAIFVVASLQSGGIRISTQGVPGLPTWIMAAVFTSGGLMLLRHFQPGLRNALDGVLNSKANP
ncbi:MAG: hypothetical protein KKD00_05700 [Gammaproteobacteria bacterium]|nr:hypothetical protein [Gammaproteobacteria bacterium]